MGEMEKIQAIVDIGSSRLRVLIVQGNDYGQFKALGCGVVSSEAVKSGEVKDIGLVKFALSAAIEEAERQSGYEIHNVDIGIGGAQVIGLNSEAEVDVPDGQVSAEDVTNLVLQAREKVSEKRHQILHVLPQQYFLDRKNEVFSPISMSARHIYASYHVVRAEQIMCATLKRCIELAGIGVDTIVSNALASSYLSTTAEERDEGVLFLDIGAGTTDFLLWLNGVPIASGGINIGGEYISSEIARHYSIIRQDAEMLKCQQGAMFLPMMKTSSLDLSDTSLCGNQKIESVDFVSVIYQNYEKIFQELRATLGRLGMKGVPLQSIVMTGGAAQITGLAHYVNTKFSLPVRLAQPEFVDGLQHLQYDPAMMSILGMAKLRYEPLPDHVWEMKPKRDIIRRLKMFFS